MSFKFVAEEFVDRFVFARAKPVGVGLKNNLAAIDEDNFVENTLDVSDEVGRYKYASACVEIIKNGIENVIACGWVDTSERFVENIELSVETHDKDELELLLHAFAHFDNAHSRVEVEILEELLGFGAVEIIVELAEISEGLRDSHSLVEVGALGEIGDLTLALDADRLALE